MLPPTRKLLKYLKEHVNTGWEVGADVAKRSFNLGNHRYLVIVDRSGGFEIRGGDEMSFVMDRPPERIPSGLAATQYRKDMELAKDLFLVLRESFMKSYTEDVNYFVD